MGLAAKVDCTLDSEAYGLETIWPKLVHAGTIP